MKTVLITGANRGIGLAHARRFAERGATVYATARKPDEAEGPRRRRRWRESAGL